MDGNTVPNRQPATYEDLCALPEPLVGEILDGELVASPRPTPIHLRAETVLTSLLGPPFDLAIGGPGGWWIVTEPEIHLGQHGQIDVVVPDVASWRRSHLPAVPRESHYRTSPDWICEVLSEQSVKRDRVTKLNLYRRHAVPFYWLIDPVARTLEVLRLEGDRWILDGAFAEADAVSAAPFTDITFNLAHLWAGEAPTDAAS